MNLKWYKSPCFWCSVVATAVATTIMLTIPIVFYSKTSCVYKRDWNEVAYYSGIISGCVHFIVGAITIILFLVAANAVTQVFSCCFCCVSCSSCALFFFMSIIILSVSLDVYIETSDYSDMYDSESEVTVNCDDFSTYLNIVGGFMCGTCFIFIIFVMANLSSTLKVEGKKKKSTYFLLDN